VKWIIHRDIESRDFRKWFLGFVILLIIGFAVLDARISAIHRPAQLWQISMKHVMFENDLTGFGAVYLTEFPPLQSTKEAFQLCLAEIFG